MATSLRFRAALLSGDGEAQTIAAIARAVGMKMAGDEDMSGIKSIAAVEWLYRKDPTLLRRVLEIVRDAWPDDAPPVGSTVQDPRTRGEILKGIGRFILEQDPDDERMVERLSKVTPSQLQTPRQRVARGLRFVGVVGSVRQRSDDRRLRKRKERPWQ
jgi:hypothetical protein